MTAPRNDYSGWITVACMVAFLALWGMAVMGR